MVAQLLRLKLALLANSFRRRPLLFVGMVLALLYGLALVALAVVGIASLRAATPDIARAIVVPVGSLVVLAAIVLPLTFGVDDTIDPRRFALFGIRTGRLSFGIAISAFVSIPTLVVAALAVAQIVTWSRESQAMLLAVLSAIILVPTCVLASRVSSAFAATFLGSRRARDVTGILLVFVLALSAPIVAVLATADWESRVLPVLRRLTSVLSWTPLGAAWSLPADAATDRMDTILEKLGIAGGFLLLLVILWRVLVGIMLLRPERETDARRYTGLGWFERLPATPAGAVAARSLSYWSRDSRYQVALAAIPILPIVMVTSLLVVGVPGEIIVWLPVPVMCLFLGWILHNDLAHDSSAFWTHVSANTRGRDDRWGRLAPALLVGVPLVVVGSLVTIAIAGDWTILPGLAGLSACVLLVGLGVSSVASAAFPYPAVHPGDSPFAQPQAIGSSGSVVQAAAFGITLALTAPVVALVVLGALFSPDWYWAALGAGLFVGWGVLIGGVLLGGRIVTRRGPELLAFTLQN